jgi:TrmH family RNA methyltransferase
MRDDRSVDDVIDSAQNSHLKRVRKLERRRTRDSEGAFVVEGEDLVLAGLDTGSRARLLLIDAERPPQLDVSLVTCPVLAVRPDLLAAVSSMPHPPRVIAVFDQPEPLDLAVALDERSRSGQSGPWIALDGLADPGNVGTVLRSAAALGAGGVVTLPDTADPFSPKAGRASMGAVFRTPLVRLDAPGTSICDELDAVRAANPALRVVALDSGGEVELSDTPLDPSTIVIVGSERRGVAPELLDHADLVARIPQDPRVESVNAGVAASIALYEWRRSTGRGT